MNKWGILGSVRSAVLVVTVTAQRIQTKSISTAQMARSVFIAGQRAVAIAPKAPINNMKNNMFMLL